MLRHDRHEQHRINWCGIDRQLVLLAVNRRQFQVVSDHFTDLPRSNHSGLLASFYR